MNEIPSSTRGPEASDPVSCSARLVAAIRSVSGNLVLSAGTTIKIVAESDDGQEWCVEHSADIGGWPGEPNRLWIPKSHAQRPNDRDQRRKGGFRLWFRVVFPALLFAASPLVLLTYNREFPRRSLGAWRAQRATPCSTTNNSTNLLETPLLPVEPFSGPSGSPLRCQALLRLS